MSLELVMPSNRLILYHPLFFLPSISPNVRVFSNKLSLCHQVVEVLELQLPHQSFQWIFRMDFLYNTGLISLLSKELSRVFSSTTIQNHQFFSTQPSLWSNSHIHTWVLEKKKKIALTIWTLVTNSWNLLKLVSIESVMPSNHLLSPSPTFNLSQDQGLFK